MSQTEQFRQGDAAGGAASDGGGIGTEAQAKAGEMAEQAQEKAQQAASRVQDKVRRQIDERSGQVAAQVNDQASDLRSIGETLRQQGKDGPAEATEKLAHYAEQVGGYLERKDSHALLADAEDFGRRQPWLLAAGGLALGFAASRFLKASSSQRYERRTTVPQPAGVYPSSASSQPYARGAAGAPTTEPALASGPVM
jgi:hypothetical protein